MKKLLIGLTVLFSFLFINNVNAENITFDKQHMFEYVTMTNTAELTNEEVIELLTNAGYAESQINKYIALRNYRIANNKEGKYYFLNPGDGVFFNSSRLMINMDNNAVQGFFTLHGSGTFYSIRYHIQSAYSSRTYYDAKLVDNIYNVYASSTSGWIASQSDLFGFYLNADNTINFNINSTHLNYFYETNMDIDFFYNGGDFTDDMIIGENTYPKGSTLPINSLTGYNSLIDQGPKIYQYEDQIDTSNIDFIRVKFDVNDIICTDSIIQFDYSIENSNLNKLPYPYIETLYDYYLTADENDTSTILYKTYELNGYSNSIFEDVLHDINATVYYNFVLDVNGIEDILTLNFSSIYNYEVEIYKSDGTSDVLYQTGSSSLSKNDYLPAYNMVTVDLSDYFGIVLMPKVFSTTDNLGLIYNAIKYDQDYRIYLNGVYDIYIRSTPGNYVTLTDTFKSYSNPYFSKRFKYVSFVDNKNTNLIRIVKSSSLNNNNFITFDSNMYSYSLINSSDEVVILPDANLPDNTINSGTIDEDVSLDEANNTFEDSELSITNFINDIDETLQYVHNVFNIFFNKLPILIQSLLIFVFNIVCIFMLLRMGGWLG